MAWRISSEWKLDRKAWGKWFWSLEEAYKEDNYRRWSLILWIVGFLLLLLRRANLFENIKHVIPILNPYNETPARFIDSYIIFSWSAVGILTWMFHDTTRSLPLQIFALWWAIQTLQTSIYHNIWRKIAYPPGHVMRQTYSHIRNAIIGVVNFAVLCWLFGLMYRWSNGAIVRGDGLKADGLWDYIYFGFVTGATIGYGDMHPVADNVWIRILVILQIMMSLFMLVVILAQIIGSIEPLQATGIETASEPHGHVDNEN